MTGIRTHLGLMRFLIASDDRNNDTLRAHEVLLASSDDRNKDTLRALAGSSPRALFQLGKGYPQDAHDDVQHKNKNQGPDCNHECSQSHCGNVDIQRFISQASHSLLPEKCNKLLLAVCSRIAPYRQAMAARRDSLQVHCNVFLLEKCNEGFIAVCSRIAPYRQAMAARRDSLRVHCNVFPIKETTSASLLPVPAATPTGTQWQ